mgnify:CR=1 FL=1
MTTTLERLVEIEDERQETMSDPDFQKWMKKLKVSSTHKDKEPIYRANEMNREYDFSKILSKRSSFSIFNY